MKAFRALLLVLALSVCTFADGNMPNDRTGNMPNGKTGEMPNEKTGVMPNGKTSAIDPVTEIALNLLQSLLPLF